MSRTKVPDARPVEVAAAEQKRGMSAMTVARITVWTATVVACVFGLHTLNAMAVELHRAEPLRLDLVDIPHWLQQPEHSRVLEELQSTAGLYTDDDVLDSTLCSRVAANLGASPWVNSVERVVKQPGWVRAFATYRQPITMLVYGEIAYLVDENGVRLPPTVRQEALDARQWIVLTGARGLPGPNPIPRIGAGWPGDEVRHGLRLVRMLLERSAAGEMSCREELKAVDVSNFDRGRDPLGGPLRIITHGDVVIHWGVAPGEEYGVERSADGKLGVLDQIARSNGGKLPDVLALDLRPTDTYRKVERPR